MVYEIEKGLRNGSDREVQSKAIGEAVMNALVHLDEVAYIRFASVYREFKDVQRFLEELHELVEKKSSKWLIWKVISSMSLRLRKIGPGTYSKLSEYPPK